MAHRIDAIAQNPESGSRQLTDARDGAMPRAQPKQEIEAISRHS
jgi:hypothetical protein